MANQEPGKNGFEPVPFLMHPRVFAALGKDLVTSDLVAVIELVKNSYDAFATRVDVRLLNDEAGKLYLEIQDDGLGMDDKILRDVWCVVATPFRENHQTSERLVSGKTKQRRVSGAKGLGRLSSARLGNKLDVFTRKRGKQPWKLVVQWEELADAPTLDQCRAQLWPATPAEFDVESGTLLRITGLESVWPEEEIDELSEGLSRLKPPFEQLGDFKVFLTDARRSAQPMEIEASPLIENPLYRIKGELRSNGALRYTYGYQPYKGKGRTDSDTISWTNILLDIKQRRDKKSARYLPEGKKPECGPFNFEIRAWDLDPETVETAANKFKIRKSTVRSEIRTFKGISVYRDQILVLPKSETSRDWLGLDLRRVSKTGTRISTSQIVGYVGITAEANPEIDDTSDRERLARNNHVQEFESLLKYIVEILEIKRDEDRPHDDQKMGDLFKNLDSQAVVEEVRQLASEKAQAAEVLPHLENFSARLEAAKSRIEQTFGYYNRLATIGTLSQMLVHEVGNNNVIIGRFLATAKSFMQEPDKFRSAMKTQLASAETALSSLERLADRFMPLATRGFKRGRRSASFKQALETCREAREKDVEHSEISWETDLASTDEVKIDPGELHAIMLNLIDNAIYWLARSEVRKRRLKIDTRKISGRLKCRVMDSGPGIEKGDEDKIFLPGVTKRPNGFGMGLTVAAEIIEGHGGSIHVESPGELRGATFIFDLPLSV
jgi:signal transduction histidine kinase